MFNVLLRSQFTFLVHLDILSIVKNNYTFDGLRRVCQQKTEMYTTGQIGWLQVQGTWLGLVSQSVNDGPSDLQVKLVIIIQQTSCNKVSFLVAQV